jgi:hypothetical protein
VFFEVKIGIPVFRWFMTVLLRLGYAFLCWVGRKMPGKMTGLKLQFPGILIHRSLYIKRDRTQCEESYGVECKISMSFSETSLSLEGSFHSPGVSVITPLSLHPIFATACPEPPGLSHCPGCTRWRGIA